MLMDDLFEEPQASKMDKLRDEKRRQYGQITYDCHKASVTPDGVVCRSKGFKVKQPLRKILRGHSAQACHKCQKFEGGE